MEKIKSISKSRLHVDSHAEFNENVYLAVKEAAFTNVEMAALLPLYLESITLEKQIISRPRASIYTQDVQGSDSIRGGLLKQLIGTINSARKGNIPAMKDAAEKLWIIVKPFRKVYTNFMTDETDQINNLVKLILADECEEWLRALYLETVVLKLKHENIAFRKKYTTRAIERGTLPGNGITTIEQRKVVDKLYTQIIDLLNSVVVSARAKIETGFPEEKMDTVTVAINSYIDQYKLIIANQAKKRKEKEEKLFQ
ncbi:hypothetical protein M2459_001546 [Parabacteroides sp. PF5-5]|uniref:DUF6261 family protein n=1 Tax=unclassified Parabacteroides TaxID=2649774 RepID=UPI002476EE5E|nr:MULTISPECIES: DUF6261 family protein [unclassified Parabacteroides]MDH6304810.1 hypothetical protein [Parabacteroides sp. PH5-39]MDH6315576.1 hypothetical protein [Parabacteroides sp. PF5-13]MDH6319236.1 hypothetical protein [Parabacteroides sp. PH5-13]MDH6322967.1 hypothetical protein [Parabacteroides sp. PH5-8]MDH6326769.1 hypothetical protein [Parabacteroides sp. PH5-41]